MSFKTSQVESFDLSLKVSCMERDEVAILMSRSVRLTSHMIIIKLFVSWNLSCLMLSVVLLPKELGQYLFFLPRLSKKNSLFTGSQRLYRHCWFCLNNLSVSSLSPFLPSPSHPLLSPYALALVCWNVVFLASPSLKFSHVDLSYLDLFNHDCIGWGSFAQKKFVGQWSNWLKYKTYSSSSSSFFHDLFERISDYHLPRVMILLGIESFKHSLCFVVDMGTSTGW